MIQGLLAGGRHSGGMAATGLNGGVNEAEFPNGSDDLLRRIGETCGRDTSILVTLDLCQPPKVARIRGRDSSPQPSAIHGHDRAPDRDLNRDRIFGWKVGTASTSKIKITRLDRQR